MVLPFTDLAVVIGSEIDFFARNKTLTGQANVGEAVALTGVTYDDTTRTMYLSDTRNNVSIFSNDLTKKNFTSTPLLKSECPENAYELILRLCYDKSAMPDRGYLIRHSRKYVTLLANKFSLLINTSTPPLYFAYTRLQNCSFNCQSSQIEIMQQLSLLTSNSANKGKRFKGSKPK